jgi:CDGSH-type Zn-finger protein
MTTPEIAPKAPFRVDVEAGRTYWWSGYSAWGQSKAQPACDGTHNSL